MSAGMIGKKLGMTQIFDESSNQIPVTVVEAGPCTILDIRTPEKNGYAAITLGFGKKDINKVNKPQKGYFKRAADEGYKVVREFRVSKGALEKYELGQKITTDVFKIGDILDVTGKSKGKGFTGVVKRWGFRGGSSSHGSRFHRAPGSIGMCAWPAKTFRGKKMPGHKGNTNITIKNLTIVDIKPDRNIILIKGAVPGARNGIVRLKGKK